MSPYQTSPRIAEMLATIRDDLGNRQAQFATYCYTKPNLVFYLDQPVPALDDESAALEFLNTGNQRFLVMPRSTYEQLRERLNKNIDVVHVEPKFLKPEQEIVVVGSSSTLFRAVAQARAIPPTDELANIRETP